MKFLFIAALLLCASCAPPPRPYPNPPSSSRGNQPAPLDNRPAPAAPESRSSGQATGSAVIQQDAADCERQAALSASAGGRAEAFNNCMKARSRTTN